jgi:hypothetical protein
MNMDTTVHDLTPHVQTAEKAVATITDPRLREIAFGRILDHLLKSQGTVSETTTGSASRKRSPNTSGRRSSQGVRAWMRELVDEQFFSEPKSLKQIVEELSNRSHHLRSTDLTSPLQNLCHNKVLRRRKQAGAGGGKEVLHWSNW